MNLDRRRDMDSDGKKYSDDRRSEAAEGVNDDSKALLASLVERCTDDPVASVLMPLVHRLPSDTGLRDALRKELDRRNTHDGAWYEREGRRLDPVALELLGREPKDRVRF